MEPNEKEQFFRSFTGLSFDDFRRRASDPNLSPNEKIGFPSEYRDGLTEVLFSDISTKVPALKESDKVVMDIGCGCGDLAQAFLQNSSALGQKLFLCDSAEMLAQLPAQNGCSHVPGIFPGECGEFLQENEGTADAVIAYSVFQIVFGSGCSMAFLDSCLRLLKPGGRCVIGDIPNQSMRNRFFSSAAGIQTHHAFTQSDEDPVVKHYASIPGTIDDSIVLSMLARGRSAGFHSYLLPQDGRLPMSSRREDLVFIRP